MNWLLNCRFGEEFDWDVLGAACCLQIWDGWYAKILFHQGMEPDEPTRALSELATPECYGWFFLYERH